MLKAIVEVFAELLVQDHVAQVAVRGGNHPDVHARGAGAAYGLEFALLEHTQELGLKFKRHVADFIKEQRATIRQRKAANMRIDGTGESPPFRARRARFREAQPAKPHSSLSQDSGFGAG